MEAHFLQKLKLDFEENILHFYDKQEDIPVRSQKFSNPTKDALFASFLDIHRD
jgi:hypothetical protein|tara:strand:- start:347 stop:505 length:159 start_codon:yes stop_codon:yes gene_type:complete